MNCDRVQILLNGYMDDELDLVTALDIEEHLRSCVACTRQRQSLEALHAVVSDKSLYHPAPAYLEKRIRSSLRKAGPESTRWPVFSWRFLAPAAALLGVLLIIAGFFGRSLFITNQERLLAQEVQTAHVRSLMTSHLTDVVSSDQHTVKPWFDGKLNFSPPVPDLAAQGFPLIGGRLEYLDGQPAAALIYQRKKHLINVFIWPVQDNMEDMQNFNFNGYHVIHWNQSGMTYWAVSDLNTDEMKAFISDFQAKAQ